MEAQESRSLSSKRRACAQQRNITAIYIAVSGQNKRNSPIMSTLFWHGAEQYAGDLECVFYGYHLDRAILKIAEAAYCLMPSLASTHYPRMSR